MSLVTKLDPRHWRFVKRLFQKIRVDHFTVSHDGGEIEVDASIDELRTALGKRHFTNSWELSYRYEGEDLNMRRPEYVDDEYEWYQLHVRAFEHEDGSVTLTVHLELEPTEWPYEHLKEVNYDDEKGDELIKPILDDAGIEYAET